ncbi:gephyrin-like molybdotransferase Glp [Propionicimonas sp.]|uniref:molybdopterin molybdotransferase MoeA n=1 Tax=Propionicimonas sp. TaxID=1955623 RepID=UPI001825237B|nr:gephyrin-like molybdotransferase Glp [Propionicimonas sp.]MBU3975340.1 molybdopterin molybdotransferase MoeA [Actinomycetota bacterium]MBA3020254.1 molybdopterin molybdotransferase MoeA [Propionicimonas sp.]MBU3986511.1 molybdopterin molybdotransferase MoeA [Actinomycetota bacterium]MBU4008080.1 molybdopterin molybdotransferase MoeA [Actinomycetota bacterium]MBU4064338.1 molybdopterin molybdotransferase MoeA [Actinomycetota bacterium]
MRQIDEHRRAALALVRAMPVVSVSIEDADAYVLARDVLAPSALPRWDNSAMDGYAVRQVDVAAAAPDAPVSLRVLADLPAGSDAQPTLVTGTAARIMTGAVVPAGADAVVPVENTDGGRSTVQINRAAQLGDHIRTAGGDAREGDVVLTAGTLLGPAQVAAGAAAGCGTLPVYRRPRVAVLSTGSELVAPGEELRLGQIPDSNSYLLAAAVRAAGCEAVRVGLVKDDPAALREVLAELDGAVDVILTSGGVSKGAYDVVKEVLAPLPGMAFVEVAMQPGKPQGVGVLAAGTPVFALPGNPVSVFVSFEVFVRPALLLMRGLVELDRPEISAEVADGWRNLTGRTQFMPVRFEDKDPAMEQLIRRAGPGGSQSHLVAALAGVQGLAVVPQGTIEVRPGDRLRTTRVDR